MIKQLLQRFRLQMIARQLRKPGLWAGRKTGKMMNKANEFLYDKLITLIEPEAANHILEIGFGNGKFFQKFFDHVPGLKMTGIDYSGQMVNCAIKANKDFIKKNQLSICKGESSHLPLTDNTYDIVFCINVIYFWENPERHLKEILRVLKPSGTFYAIFRAKESMQLMPFTRYGFHSYAESEWQQLMEISGFRQVIAQMIKEPDVLFKEKTLKIESWCITGTKPVTSK